MCIVIPDKNQILTLVQMVPSGDNAREEIKFFQEFKEKFIEDNFN